MSLSVLSAELCVDEGLSADPSDKVNWCPGLWGEVLAVGDKAVGVIEW